jgi:hypothetical protein
MASSNPPLSSTVETVFNAFLKQLEGDDTIPKESVANLRNVLEQQKLDPESLRKALFPSNGTGP